MTDLQVGDLLRYTADPREFWKVVRITPKSAWMVRSGIGEDLRGGDPTEWMFRKATVLRDFHPA